MIRTHNQDQTRLDASESIWFQNELKFVDKQQYEVVFPENMARLIVPTQDNIPEWANSYEWREFERIGKAKIIAGSADDLPRVDVIGTPNVKVIKDVGASYGYSIKEIKRAIATGTHLDVMKASACRLAIETEVDRILSVGESSHNLEGLLTLSGITPVTATTKTGGGTNWSASATSDEKLNDIYKLIRVTLASLKQAGGRVFRKFRVVLPEENYINLDQSRIGDGTTSALEQLMKSPFVESVVPWWRCTGAAANATDDRIAIFPPDKMVLAGLVPQEYTPQEAEKRNLEYIVNATGSCGGVAVRYKMAVGYMDTIDVT